MVSRDDRKFSTSSSDTNQSLYLESDDLSDEFSEEENTKLLQDDDIIHENDYLLVKFPLKSNTLFYIGKVLEVTNYSEYLIKFLRRKTSDYTFYYPVIDDISTVDRSDIVLKLPQPTSAKTARTSSFLSFRINLSVYNIN